MESHARLVVCCDGTSNSEYLGEERSPPTNVSRISRAIRPSYSSGNTSGRQIVLYLPGVGTDEGNYFNLLNQGLGVEDDIILIGYSRGAFAVRCIADFVLEKGLLPKDGLHHIPSLFQEWLSPPIDGQPNIAHENLRKPKIKACALWDTVNSAGFPRPWPFSRARPAVSFVNSQLPENVEHTFQALSLFEHRFYFHPVVLRRTERSASILQQCWFPGYHADIGGGNDKEVLAHFALAWIIAKLGEILDIDERAFWYRRNGQPTWVLPDDLVIPDPYNSSWIWRTTKSSHRAPRVDFWDALGIYHEHPGAIDFSMEKIHPSARFMVQNNYMKNHFQSCLSLTGRAPQEQQPQEQQPQEQQPQQQWFWPLAISQPLIRLWRRRRHSIRPNVQADTAYRLLEEEFDPAELKMLRAWAVDEHNLLLEQAEPGRDHPNTIIVEFQNFVQ
ncbi:hypothetical protein EKO27_g2679 [Xylaria grammica]|uniref:T6SS Phospholipase effector Tle1-like catalytic domain-containing protein n=1 Tax=Xylaria grammica TaxID=363999 RepID=A0A439DDH3_9PEZI|nr:hypothetical protein EKO27_g2679 [Xylaria grammica]